MEEVLHNIKEYTEQSENLNNSSCFPTDPQNLAKYSEYFKDIETNAVNSTTFREQLQIRYRIQFTSNFVKQPKAILTQLRRGGCVAKYHVLQGSFKLDINVIVVPTLAPSVSYLDSGSFGKICQVEGHKSTSVSKRFLLTKRDKLLQRDSSNSNSFIETFNSQDIKEAVIECSLAKICSMLGIGPQFHMYMGFDLILFDDCIEFYMERCRKHNQRPSHISFHQMELSLKKRVRAMHMMCLIHKDIKSSNVLYSPSKKELVLCDFGISDFIPEKLGYKSLTTRQGTRSFMSPGMARLKYNEEGWVDLYYNDMYGLKLTILQIKQFTTQEITQQSSSQKSILQKVVNTCYLLLQNKQVQELIQNNNFIDALIQYFPQLRGQTPDKVQMEIMPLDPILLVQWTDKIIELPYFIQFCNAENIIVKNLKKFLQKFEISRSDLKNFQKIDQTRSKQLIQCFRIKTFEKQYEIFKKKNPFKPDDIVKGAQVIYELLISYLKKPIYFEKRQILIFKLQELCVSNPNITKIKLIYDKAHLLNFNLFNQLPTKISKPLNVQQNILLSISRTIIQRKKFGPNQFSKVLYFLSSIKQHHQNASVLVSLAYQKVGKTKQAIKILSEKVNQTKHLKSSYWRTVAICNMVRLISLSSPQKAYQFCQQKLSQISAKYKHILEFTQIQIKRMLGNTEEYCKLMDCLIQRTRKTEGSSNIFIEMCNKYARKLCQFGLFQKGQSLVQELAHKYRVPETILILAKCKSFLNKNKVEGLDLFAQAVKVNWSSKGQSFYESQIGILMSLLKKALQITSDNSHRSLHFKHIFQKTNELVNQLRNEKILNKKVLMIQYVAILIKSAKQLQLKSQEILFQNQLNETIENMWTQKQYNLSIVAKLFLKICQLCPQLMLKPIDKSLKLLNEMQYELKNVYFPIRQTITQCYLAVNEIKKAQKVFSYLLRQENLGQLKNCCFFSDADNFFQRKQYNFAIKVYGLGNTPLHRYTPFRLAFCYDAIGNREKCEEYIVKFLNSLKDKYNKEQERTFQIMCFKLLSELNFDYKDFVKSVSKTTVKLQKNIFNPKLFYNCGMYFLVVKKYSLAGPWFKRALLLSLSQAKLKNTTFLIRLADANLFTNRPRKSITLYYEFFKLGGQIEKNSQFIRFAYCCTEISSERLFYRKLLEFDSYQQVRHPLCQILLKKKLYLHYLVLKEDFLKQSQQVESALLNVNQIAEQSQPTEQPTIRMAIILKELMVLKKMKQLCLRSRRSIRINTELFRLTQRMDQLRTITNRISIRQ